MSPAGDVLGATSGDELELSVSATGKRKEAWIIASATLNDLLHQAKEPKYGITQLK